MHAVLYGPGVVGHIGERVVDQGKPYGLVVRRDVAKSVALFC
jgi:hypothetical protein